MIHVLTISYYLQKRYTRLLSLHMIQRILECHRTNCFLSVLIFDYSSFNHYTLISQKSSKLKNYLENYILARLFNVQHLRRRRSKLSFYMYKAVKFQIYGLLAFYVSSNTIIHLWIYTQISIGKSTKN